MKEKPYYMYVFDIKMEADQWDFINKRPEI